MKKRKTGKGLLKGGTKDDHDQGETSNEDAVSLVLTERSMRIVDRVSGETYFKTLLTDVSFIASVETKKLRVFAVVHKGQFGARRCYMFNGIWFHS